MKTVNEIFQEQNPQDGVVPEWAKKLAETYAAQPTVLEVGKVYQDINYPNSVVRKINDFGGYGFWPSRAWCDNIGVFEPFGWHPYPQSEWEALLIAKAEKDYPKGTRFRSVYSGDEYVSCGKFEFVDSIITSLNKGCVFNSGQWAEILPAKVEVDGWEVCRIDEYVRIKERDYPLSWFILLKRTLSDVDSSSVVIHGLTFTKEVIERILKM